MPPESAIDTAAWKYVRGLAPDPENRERDDFYPTPPEATRALLAVERFDGPIWEPACGDGAIGRVLEAAGYEVIATDLVDRGYGTPRVDFLMERRLLAPNIVTNPPFKLALGFAHRALELGPEKIALLARLAWLEGYERRRFFEATELARVWVFARRIQIKRAGWDGGQGGGSMIAYAWFVWERGHEGPPTLGWIDPRVEGAISGSDEGDVA